LLARAIARLRAARRLLYAARMTHRLVLVAALAALAACGNKKEGSSKATASDEPAAAPAKQPLTAGFFGKQPAPLGLLAKVPWGAPAADARKAAPDLWRKDTKPDADYVSNDDPSIDGVTYGLGIDKESHKVSRMSVDLPVAARAMLATAWGPGKDAVDSVGKPRTYWFDPAGGWRAYVEPGFAKDVVSLDLHPYLPAAKLLGDGPDTLGFAPQGILGATIADVRARFPTTIVERSAQQAAAEQKQVGDFVGKDLDKELGPARADVRLDLPPTEWEDFWTRVQITWTDDGKVEDVWFDLPYEAYKPAKDEIFALITKKWGTGKEISFLGEKALLFGDKAPYAIVTDDQIQHAWNVRVTTKKPE
jgi:hypothetical protein